MKIKQQPYRGARDFYPEQKRLQNYIFQTWQNVVESYGYEAYDASIVEHLELYQLKNQTNLEILDQQIYTFEDRGGRAVVLRPEMTPSVARLVAQRRQELSYPLRWYSIPNLWRYERPQVGRLREHWQLNVDLFGLAGYEAELELILLATEILHRFGATTSMYQIRCNSRQLLQEVCRSYLQIDAQRQQALIPLFDRYDKMPEATFDKACRTVLDGLGDAVYQRLHELLTVKTIADLPTAVQALPACQNIQALLDDLQLAHVDNCQFDLKLVRGFNYYTDIVFEFFNCAADHQRAMLGGGRYDHLLSAFNVDALPAAGFGLGDVTMIDFLNSHNLLPTLAPPVDLSVILLEGVSLKNVLPMLKTLRSEGLKVSVDSRLVKVSKKIEVAVKKQVPYVLFVGPTDLQEELFNLRHLPSREETRLSLARIVSKLVAV